MLHIILIVASDDESKAPISLGARARGRPAVVGGLERVVSRGEVRIA